MPAAKVKESPKRPSGSGYPVGKGSLMWDKVAAVGVGGMYVSPMFQRWTQLDSNLEKHAEPWFSTGCTANHRATWGGSGPPQTEWVLLDVAMMMSSGQLAVSMVMHSAFLTRSWTFARLRICGCHGTKQARYLPCVFSFSNFRSLYSTSSRLVLKCHHL